MTPSFTPPYFRLLLATVLLAAPVVFAASPPLVIEFPRGGELFVQGQTQVIRVKARALKNIQVNLSRDGGVTFESIGMIDTTSKDRTKRGTLLWPVNGPSSANCVIQATGIVPGSLVSINSAPFTIGVPVFAQGTTTAPGEQTQGLITTNMIAQNAVTSPKLAPQAVSNDKVNSGPASAGMVLSADGSGGANWDFPASQSVAPAAGNSIVGALNDPATTNALNAGILFGSANVNITGTSASAIFALSADQLDGLDSTQFWKLDGNTGSTAGTHFLGTADNQPLEFKVNSLRALRIEPGSSPSLLGGFSGNSIIAGAVGAAIGGGGATSEINRVTDDFGFIAGGADNLAGNDAGTASDAPYAAIGGGRGNRASALSASVSGGSSNNAAAMHASVGGGNGNAASGVQARVGGGGLNIAAGFSSTIAGGSSNRANGTESTVGGGSANISADQAVVAGGQLNTAGGPFSSVGGGQLNTASGNGAAVGGGGSNTAAGLAATVPGGEANAASANYSFAAGRRAKAAHDGALVWADSTDADFSSGAANEFSVRATGGVRFVTAVDAGNAPATVTTLAADGTLSTPALRLLPGPSAGSPSSGDHLIGEFYVDINGVLFYCHASGAPGTWKQLAP